MDVWQKLQTEEKPILLYGMGNGADKILRVCAQKQIPIAGVFASDAFVRGHSFHGMRVLTYREAVAQIAHFTVLLAFATHLPDVMAQIAQIAREQTLYVPDVPVCGETAFDEDFFEEHRAAFAASRALFADDESRRLFDLLLHYKLSGELSDLFAAQHPRAQMFSFGNPHGWQTYADLGAYNGDTLREIFQYAAPTRIFAMEPDARNFKKLELTVRELGLSQNATLVQAAAWDRTETVPFDASGNRNAGIHAGKKVREVRAMPPDALFCGEKVDYIKYDVEGAERRALCGTAQTIHDFAPDLCVSCYHRNEDLFDLPLLLHAMHPSYRLYLRRTPCLPAWEINLLATEAK